MTHIRSFHRLVPGCLPMTCIRVTHVVLVMLPWPQIFATEIGGNSYERITLNGIRERTQPGDRIMCVACTLPCSVRSTQVRAAQSRACV